MDNVARIKLLILQAAAPELFKHLSKEIGDKMTVQPERNYTLDERVPHDKLKAEHALQLIHHNRLAGHTPEQILETVEHWLYGVMVAGGVVVGHGRISAKVETRTEQRTEE